MTAHSFDDVGICVPTLLRDPMSCDRESFAAIVRASKDAGFSSISLWPFQAAQIGFDDTAAMLDDAGLAVLAVEASTQWASGDTAALRDEATGMAEAAERFGARIVGAATMDARLDSFDRAVEGFATLCAVAATRDLTVSLEFLPWSGVPDLATAWRIVEQSGAANGGVLLDTWHWQRQPGGPDLELLHRIPGRHIAYVQVCDTNATIGADLLQEAMTDRQLPGEGTVDFASLFGALDDIGATPYVAAEIFNTALTDLGATVAAERMRRSCVAALGL